MRSAITLSVAALAGSALAAPSYGRPAKVQNVHYDVVVETVVTTVYVTEGYQAYPAPSKAPAYKPNYPAAPAETTVVYETPAPAPTSSSVYVAPPAPTSEAPAPSSEAPAPSSEAPEPTSEAPAPTSEAPEPTPEPTTTAVYTPAPEPTTEAPEPTSEAPKPSSAAVPSGDSDYMSIVDEWRAKLGLSKLECSPELEKNAMNVVVEGNGVMKHKLNPGTYGQVLAPGKPGLDSFKSVFVGGWLCEIPTLPGLDGVCTEMSKGWSYEGQTGHAEILTSPNYSKIGCQVHEDIWCCDLA